MESFFREAVLEAAKAALPEEEPVLLFVPELLYEEVFLLPAPERWGDTDTEEAAAFFVPVPLLFFAEDFEDEVPFDEVERFAVDVLFFAVEDFPDEANVIPPGFA